MGGFLAVLTALFVYLAVRSGPLAPIPVIVTTIEKRSIRPALYGVGTVEARFTYRIGPTSAGRVKRVEVQVGDRVKAGQILGEMDSVDLDDRIRAREAALRQAEAGVAAAQAQIQDASARGGFNRTQERKYERLLSTNAVSQDTVDAKRRERMLSDAGQAAAQANLDAARQALASVNADMEGLAQQRANFLLKAPVDGLVTAREADPGTTVVAGQSVVDMIDPSSLWVHVRFDQLRAGGLAAGLPAQIATRSRSSAPVAGHVLRVEPLADSVTEEIMAKVAFENLPTPPPPIGELAEVTVSLPALDAARVAPNACIQRVQGRLGVWVIENDAPRFTPIKAGASDLDGWVQILDGLTGGERVVVYSQRALGSRSRVKIVDRLPGVSP
jgi:RND family efflux transporter MFP subunit